MISYDGADELDSHCMLSSNLGLEDSRDGVVWFRHSRGTKMSQKKYLSNWYTTRDSEPANIPQASPFLFLQELLSYGWTTPISTLWILWCKKDATHQYVLHAVINRSPFPTNDSPRIKLVPHLELCEGHAGTFVMHRPARARAASLGGAWIELNFLEKLIRSSCPKLS